MELCKLAQEQITSARQLLLQRWMLLRADCIKISKLDTVILFRILWWNNMWWNKTHLLSCWYAPYLFEAVALAMLLHLTLYQIKKIHWARTQAFILATFFREFGDWYPILTRCLSIMFTQVIPHQLRQFQGLWFEFYKFIQIPNFVPPLLLLLLEVHSPPCTCPQSATHRRPIPM